MHWSLKGIELDLWTFWLVIQKTTKSNLHRDRAIYVQEYESFLLIYMMRWNERNKETKNVFSKEGWRNLSYEHLSC